MVGGTLVKLCQKLILPVCLTVPQSLYLGLKSLNLPLAGVISMSSWVTSCSCMWPVLGTLTSSPPPTLMVHGSNDPMINIAWSRTTRDRLNELANTARLQPVEWCEESGIGHEPGPIGLQKVQEFIIARL